MEFVFEKLRKHDAKNGTSTLDGEQLSQIISKSIHNWRNYAHDAPTHKH